MAYVLQAVIGKPGAIIINIGVIITVFGAWIANTLLAEEVAYQAGIRKLFPKYFAQQNKHGMPGHSMLITDLLVQILLLSFLFTTQAYSFLSKLSSAAILLPYTLVALFQLKETYLMRDQYHDQLLKDILVGVITTIYMIWMIYASGISYVLLTIMALVPGTIMYVYVRSKQHQKVFANYEWIIFIIFAALFVYAIIKLPVVLAA
ncbi:MAG: amino acid permease, partial [Limosilactobacillus sp.]